nr:TMV resistance protein N-like [Quercus suber]
MSHNLKKEPEAEFIQDIVKVIKDKLNYKFSIDTKNLVGINFRVDKLKSHLVIESNDVCIIGIWGMGGMGKTTLARVVYGMVSSQFEACCFIANVREVSEKNGLLQLQQTLLNEFLMDRDIIVHDVDSGVLTIKNRLCHKKILLVLDDVNELDQLKKLAGENDWFGPGSRIIITTRDEHLLVTRKVDGIYKIEGLNYDEALHLFNMKAFEKEHPPEDFLGLSKAFVRYASGLPLAIEILGSLLFNRSIAEWGSELERLKEFPEQKILSVLRISYDGLPNIEKEIFLNIACFFCDKDQDSVIEILDYLELHPKIGLRILIDKSLVKLQDNQLWMHDLLQEMGRDIVRQESPKDPGKRSRLWLYEDINKVLKRNTGTKAIEGIVLKLPEPKEAHWNLKSFLKMHCLKFLIIDNVHLIHDPKHLPSDLIFLHWNGYPSKYFPSSFQAKGVSFDDRYDTLHYEKRYDIIIPGSEIPKWFSHQSMGAEVNAKEPYSHLCNEWMGIAVCVVFSPHPHHQIHNYNYLHCLFITNGEIGVLAGYGDFVFLSDHIWLLYMLPQYVARSPAWESDVNGLWECDANGFSQIGIRIETHGLKVKKCGFRMVYKKDIEDLNQTMAQTSDNNIIPHEGLDVLHHNFDNLAVVVEGNKAKKTHDEYDRAGPSGEGSSKNIPSLKLIERLPEFMDLGNSDCEEPSEYMECGEE